MATTDPNPIGDCPLDQAAQTRNLLLFAACTALQYLTAPVAYVGVVQAPLCHELFEPGIFFRQFLRTLRIVERLGIAQSSFDFRKAAGKFLNLRSQVHGSNLKSARQI